MAKKKSEKKAVEEKRQETDEDKSVKFFEQERAEYEKRMTLATETDKANSEEIAEEKDASDDSNAGVDEDQQPSDENHTENGDDKTDAETSEKNN